MPADSKKNNPNQEEIDLLYLFVKLGEFIKKSVLELIKFIISILVFLLQKWYYIAIAIILAILSAFVLDKTSDPYFQSHLTLRSNATQNQPIISSLDRLGEYANDQNHAALAEELNLSIEEANDIKGIETFWYFDIGNDGIFDGLDVDRKFLSDTSIVKIDSVFSIRAKVYEPDMLGNLEKSLVYYLENNSFLKSLNKQRIANLEAQVNQIEYEIEKLDSLQKREYYTNQDDLRQKEGQIVFTSENEVRMYHSQMFHLLELKQDCKRDLNIYGGVVTLLEGFSNPLKPENGIVQSVKKIIWFYLGFAIILAALIKFRRKIWTTK